MPRLRPSRAVSISTCKQGLPSLIAFVVILIAGGQTATCAETSAATAEHDPETYPLRFKQHNFEAHCYNTLDCHVVYNGTNTTRPAVDKVTPAPRAGDYRKSWGGAPFIGIRNFPGPVKLDWISKSGEVLSAEVDLAQVFKDELVLHDTPLDEIPEKAFKGPAGEPTIYVEVNDHTVSVYMEMLIPTKREQIPGNSNSHFRSDVILAWSKRY
jgi:hypothetical protein